ncbi:MAG: hypothetical protein WA705_25270 [Candidatus Ozemobacteraceae bacterium]
MKNHGVIEISIPQSSQRHHIFSLLEEALALRYTLLKCELSECKNRQMCIESELGVPRQELIECLQKGVLNLDLRLAEQLYLELEQEQRVRKNIELLKEMCRRITCPDNLFDFPCFTGEKQEDSTSSSSCHQRKTKITLNMPSNIVTGKKVRAAARKTPQSSVAKQESRISCPHHEAEAA